MRVEHQVYSVSLGSTPACVDKLVLGRTPEGFSILKYLRIVLYAKRGFVSAHAGRNRWTCLSRFQRKHGEFVCVIADQVSSSIVGGRENLR